MEVEHYVFLKGYGSHIIKNYAKSKLLQSLMTSYFKLWKKTSYLFKGHIFRYGYYCQSIEMYTQRFKKHNKNEFLCLPDDVIFPDDVSK